MIIEIAPFDLIEGNRFVPAERVGVLYLAWLEEWRDQAWFTPVPPDTTNYVVTDPKSVPGAPSIVLREQLSDSFAWRENGARRRASITVRMGQRPAHGFSSVSLEYACGLFRIRDLVDEVLEAYDPPLSEWYPIPKEAPCPPNALPRSPMPMLSA